MKLDHLFIRKASLQDLDSLLDLENECFTSDKMKREQYRSLLQKPSAEIILAENLNKIIGCIMILYRKNSSIARIYSLAVSPSYRQAGIAKKLSIACENLAKKRQCSTIILEVRIDNHPAISFYQKNGYEIFGSYNKFYEDGTDALRMRKIYDTRDHSNK